jgi:hypothetical protein
MTRRFVGAALAAGFSVLACCTVQAAEELPCKEIAAKLCPGASPGDAAYDNCLVQHGPQLPPACKSAVDAAQARLNTLDQFPACLEDAKKFCPAFKPGIGRIMECLRLHMTDLSEECKQEIRKRTSRY